jgi:hypothetical protein
MESKNKHSISNPKENEGAALPPIVEEYYDLCRWILAKVSKFQKDQKYILGTRLQKAKRIELSRRRIEESEINK